MIWVEGRAVMHREEKASFNHGSENLSWGWSSRGQVSKPENCVHVKDSSAVGGWRTVCEWMSRVFGCWLLKSNYYVLHHSSVELCASQISLKKLKHVSRFAWLSSSRSQTYYLSTTPGYGESWSKTSSFVSNFWFHCIDYRLTDLNASSRVRSALRRGSIRLPWMPSLLWHLHAREMLSTYKPHSRYPYRTRERGQLRWMGGWLCRRLAVSNLRTCHHWWRNKRAPWLCQKGDY